MHSRPYVRYKPKDTKKRASLLPVRRGNTYRYAFVTECKKKKPQTEIFVTARKETKRCTEMFVTLWETKKQHTDMFTTIRRSKKQHPFVKVNRTMQKYVCYCTQDE